VVLIAPSVAIFSGVRVMCQDIDGYLMHDLGSCPQTLAHAHKVAGSWAKPRTARPTRRKSLRSSQSQLAATDGTDGTDKSATLHTLSSELCDRPESPDAPSRHVPTPTVAPFYGFTDRCAAASRYLRKRLTGLPAPMTVPPDSYPPRLIATNWPDWFTIGAPLVACLESFGFSYR
jgi:hypothetical protein